MPEVVEYANISDDAKGKGWEKLMILLPVQVKLTGKWSIAGIKERPDIETFPFTPAEQPAALLRWLHEEFIHLIIGEKFLPNASEPRPTDTQKTPAKTDNPEN